MNMSICLDKAWTEAEHNTKVALVFQDAETRCWAEGGRDFIAEQTGSGSVQSTTWQISNLSDPGYFTCGVQALAQADAIVMAVREVDRFPGAFYLWVNLWLQVRAGKPGTLIALVGSSGHANPETLETRRYLHAIASQGGLELVMKEFDPTSSSPLFEPDEFRPLAKVA